MGFIRGWVSVDVELSTFEGTILYPDVESAVEGGMPAFFLQNRLQSHRVSGFVEASTIFSLYRF